MFDIFFIFSLLIFSLLCFFEFFIFNEEVLLALCFFCFIFFSFNSLGGTVSDIFQSRAAKFEADLLSSFNVVMRSTTDLFKSYSTSRTFGVKIMVLSVMISNYFSVFVDFSSFNLSRLLYTTSLSKLSEVIAFETKLLATLQKRSVSFILYPLIFQSVSTGSFFLPSKSSSNSTVTFKSKVSALKMICS